MKNQDSHVLDLPNREYNAVIIADDKVTEERAQAMLKSISVEMGPDIPCVARFMTTTEMAGQTGCEDADNLDFVIISVHNLVKCVSDGGRWLTHWLTQTSYMPRALFLLHEGEADPGWIRGLRAFAESVGVNLFSRGRYVATAVPVNRPASEVAV